MYVSIFAGVVADIKKVYLSMLKGVFVDIKEFRANHKESLVRDSDVVCRGYLRSVIVGWEIKIG